MSDLELRDHSKPCEHALIEGDEGFRFYKGNPPIWQCEKPDCPGGKKIVLREEAPLHVWTAYLNGKPFQVWSMEKEEKR